MRSDTPMVRKNFFLPEEMIERVERVSTEENCKFAEALRQLLELGLSAREDKNAHRSKMFRAIEGLEIDYKALEQRVSALEAPPPRVPD